MNPSASANASGVIGRGSSSNTAIGNMPSHRAARRNGARFGHMPAIHTGMRGRCTGRGRNVTPSIRWCRPSTVAGSPDQSRSRIASPSSRSSARSRSPVGSPKEPNSTAGGNPSPAPKTSRPWLRWSSETVSRASFHGRRRATGVTMGPSRMRAVVAASAASAIHGSCTATSNTSENRMWSQRKNPSHPASSASRPIVSNRSSSPMFGTVTPLRTLAILEASVDGRCRCRSSPSRS